MVWYDVVWCDVMYFIHWFIGVISRYLRRPEVDWYRQFSSVQGQGSREKDKDRRDVSRILEAYLLIDLDMYCTVHCTGAFYFDDTDTYRCRYRGRKRDSITSMIGWYWRERGNGIGTYWCEQYHDIMLILYGILLASMSMSMLMAAWVRKKGTWRMKEGLWMV